MTSQVPDEGEEDAYVMLVQNVEKKWITALAGMEDSVEMYESAVEGETLFRV